MALAVHSVRFLMIYRQILLTALAGTAFVASCCAQIPNPSLGTSDPGASNPGTLVDDTWQSKLSFHLHSAYGPEGVLGSIAFAGYFQATDSPREWGQGGEGYGKRVASAVAYTGVRNALAFGLDSAMHQDPHYYRSGRIGAWRRAKYAVRATIFTRTDSGGETFASWRLGSAYGAAFISNQWRPDRVNTTALSLQQGTTQLGFDVLGNLGREFWPDLRQKLLHR